MPEGGPGSSLIGVIKALARLKQGHQGGNSMEWMRFWEGLRI